MDMFDKKNEPTGQSVKCLGKIVSKKEKLI